MLLWLKEFMRYFHIQEKSCAHEYCKIARSMGKKQVVNCKTVKLVKSSHSQGQCISR
jgi:hypothetical protein